MSVTKIIAIAGGSCSGKTTIAHTLKEIIGEADCGLVCQDNYYRGLSTISNFDVPEAIEFELMTEHLKQLKAGNKIAMPTYDFATHKRKSEFITLEAKKIIIVDGILILHLEKLRDVFDIKVFVECSEAERMQRRLARDIKERGRKEKDILEQFVSQVAPLHNKYVEPSKKHADLVFQQTETLSTQSKSYKKLLDFCSETQKQA